MSLSSSLITYTLIWLITFSLSHQKMAQSTTLPLLAFFPTCILAYWRFPGDAHAPSHPYDVKEYVIRVIRSPSSTAPGASSDARVPVVGTFSIAKQVLAYLKGVSSHLCSCRCLLTPFCIFSDISYCSVSVGSDHMVKPSLLMGIDEPLSPVTSSPLFLFSLQGPMVIMSHFLGVFFFF